MSSSMRRARERGQRESEADEVIGSVLIPRRDPPPLQGHAIGETRCLRPDIEGEGRGWSPWLLRRWRRRPGGATGCRSCSLTRSESESGAAGGVNANAGGDVSRTATVEASTTETLGEDTPETVTSSALLRRASSRVYTRRGASHRPNTRGNDKQSYMDRLWSSQKFPN